MGIPWRDPAWISGAVNDLAGNHDEDGRDPDRAEVGACVKEPAE